MPQVGFETTIPVFEWAKTVHALDRAATAIGTKKTTKWKMKFTGVYPRRNLCSDM
jgi:hypothetical protein